MVGDKRTSTGGLVHKAQAGCSDTITARAGSAKAKQSKDVMAAAKGREKRLLKL